MDNKMLIDAAHPEETRVVVVRGNRVEEFDFEAENKKQLKGNIYLAKVTRVEPSLQAAFVDYGGNRHGFLAFSEIHPDYYQIPVADRQALLEQEAAEHKAANEEEDEEPPKKRRRRRTNKASQAKGDDAVQSDVVEEKSDAETSDTDTVDAKAADDEVVGADNDESTASAEPTEEASNEDAEVDLAAEAQDTDASDGASDNTSDDTGDEENLEVVGENTAEEDDAVEASNSNDDNEDDQNPDDDVESVGSEDALEEVPVRRTRPRVKQYKIQEVIKRRQIILVQVVKEERGNKGAALTTYLSLAGRYSVLMPNTDRGGGISRKITNQADRKRLRAIASDLDVPMGMGVILRTAGASRTKPEIKRDFEYLMRLWENVRDFTLKSSAPALVYEEGSLLKRSIRDLYNKDIKQVIVSGEDGYREAKDFMRMLMPSHAKNVQPYKELQPIFARYGVEAQLDAMFSTRVTLKSGGYIIINQTEALVSIDVNSGRSTREGSIEETALSTNLETAEEVARQLRLRDLAGLVVIDFIDMDENRNNRAVERRLKECLRNDRARIQVGRISHFGLLEMSRQRIRASVLESTMEQCPHCEGTGYIRDPASISLHVLRAIESHLNNGSKYNLIVRARAPICLYVLNHKRAKLMELEERFGLCITLEADDSIVGEYCTITRGERAEAPKTPAMVTPETVNIDEELARDAELDAAAEAAEAALIANDEQESNAQEEEEGTGRKRRRRRGRRRGKSADAETSDANENEDDDNTSEASSDDTQDDDEQKKKRRRRGRRGGRRERGRSEENVAASENGTENDGEDAVAAEADGASDTTSLDDSEVPSPSDDTAMPTDATNEEVKSEAAPVEIEETEAPAKKPRKRAPRKKKTEEKAVDSEEPAVKADDDSKNDKAAAEPEASDKVLETANAETTASNDGEAGKKDTSEANAGGAKKSGKSGWWQRRSFF